MAKTKTLQVGNRGIDFRGSALLPKLYRAKFGRDLIRDISRLEKNVKRKEDGSIENLDMMDLTIFEDFAYMMAKHADPTVPEDPDEWLDSIDGVLDVYLIFPELLELWSSNIHTTSIPAKK